LIALHDPDRLRPDSFVHELVTGILKPVADAMANETAILLMGRLVSINDASPLLLFWAYQAATIYRQLLPIHGENLLQPLFLMNNKLQIMSQRWLAGRKLVT
jgi:hypothetical protein